MHEADIARFLSHLLVILVTAKTLGEVTERLGQPAVLGELLGGVLLGFGFFSFFHANDATLALMAQFGVILLLFETGLHCDRSQLVKAGPVSAAVALSGVVLPFALGWGLMTALGRGGLQAVFIGAALTATSVGITARVLSDMGKLSAPEAQIVLGAAVIDDILGIVILSAVQGIAQSGALAWGPVAKEVLLAAGFLAGALALGPMITRALVGVIRRMRVRGVLIAAAVSFAFAMALLAHAMGTAMIVGAFTAGVLLAGTDRKEDVDGGLKPLSDVFVPIFFVMVGARVELGAYNPLVPGNLALLGLAAGLIALAIAGKAAAGLAARGRFNRFGIGAGMIPRGEVGLIFAQVGLASGAIDSTLYAAVVGMVVVTTFVAPPLLRKAFS